MGAMNLGIDGTHVCYILVCGAGGVGLYGWLGNSFEQEPRVCEGIQI